MNEMIPATIKPRSSTTPKLSAAEMPKMDHRKGITNTVTGHLSLRNSNIPKVKMVVGQGSPKVGAAGYTCPERKPTIG